MDFGRRLRARRQELDLSQEEVAKAIGKNQNTIAGYEAGRFKSIKHDVLMDFARVLKVDPEWILGTEEITLKKYPKEIQEWLNKPEAKDYVLEAYTAYLRDRLK